MMSGSECLFCCIEARQRFAAASGPSEEGCQGLAAVGKGEEAAVGKHV